MERYCILLRMQAYVKIDRAERVNTRRNKETTEGKEEGRNKDRIKEGNNQRNEINLKKE
jgi:hypothetical protein